MQDLLLPSPTPVTSPARPNLPSAPNAAAHPHSSCFGPSRAFYLARVHPWPQGAVGTQFFRRKKTTSNISRSDELALSTSYSQFGSNVTRNKVRSSRSRLCPRRCLFCNIGRVRPGHCPAVTARKVLPCPRGRAGRWPRWLRTRRDVVSPAVDVRGTPRTCRDVVPPAVDVRRPRCPQTRGDVGQNNQKAV